MIYDTYWYRGITKPTGHPADEAKKMIQAMEDMSIQTT